MPKKPEGTRMSVGVRIRAARTIAGLSLRAVARHVGVSAQAVSQYERGLHTPGPGVLIELSKAVGVSPDHFLRSGPVIARPLACRKHPSLRDKALLAMTARASEVLERYSRIEELLGLTPKGLPEGFPLKVSTSDETEDAAARVRTAWGIGVGPILSVVDTLEDHGIKVLRIQGPGELDAIALQASSAGYAVAVNDRSDVPGDRQRFSAAHELGHIVIRAAEGVDEEDLCNRFAGAFLVPSEVARDELGPRRRHIDLAELALVKEKYGMSMQAWVHRVEELGIISGKLARRLRGQFRDNNWRVKEPGPQMRQETPKRLRLLVLRALAEHVISRATASDVLGTDGSDSYPAETGRVPV